jgi:hypothetical protein
MALTASMAQMAKSPRKAEPQLDDPHGAIPFPARGRGGKVPARLTREEAKAISRSPFNSGDESLDIPIANTGLPPNFDSWIAKTTELVEQAASEIELLTRMQMNLSRREDTRKHGQMLESGYKNSIEKAILTLLTSKYMDKTDLSIKAIQRILASGDEVDIERVVSTLAPLIERHSGRTSAKKAVKRQARESAREVPLWRGRTDGRAVDFFSQHYGSKEDLSRRGFFADMLKSQDRKLYDALAVHVSRANTSLSEIIPTRPHRPLDDLSPDELRERVVTRREASRTRMAALRATRKQKG